MNILNRAIVASLLTLCGAGAAHGAGFAPCDDANTIAALMGSFCAVERVPGNPAGAASTPARDISLFVRKFPTDGVSRGQVWLIAGGPGESGASFYGLLPKVRKAFPGFDLLIPDHRGTGFSTRMCPDEESPASAAGSALAGAEWDACFGRLRANPAYARQFSQTNAAHDLKLLLERMPHTGKTFVYGVSYGTQLVLRTVALGAAKIDGVVLDSLVPLQDDDKADLSRRSLVADVVGRQVLASCDGSQRCRYRMKEPVETIYRRVLARAEKNPHQLAQVPGGDLKRFFGSLLDIPGAAWQIPDMIKELDDGKSDRITTVVAHVQATLAPFGAFPQSPASIPLVMMISASENNLRPRRTMDDVKAEEGGLLFSSSLPGHLVNAGVPTYPRDAWFARLPERRPPTLVLQGNRDSKTPYDAAVRHIEALRRAGPVQLFTAEGDGHFVLWANTLCAGATIKKFVLGKEDTSECVAVRSSH